MDLEQQLRVALAPVRPAPHLRVAVMARLASGSGRRGANRWVLVGAVLALGAAAAMLAVQVLQPAASSMVADSPALPVPGDAAPTVADLAMPPEEPVPARVVKTFTVQLMPLKGEVTDASRQIAIESVYAAFAEGLRLVPGLKLLESAIDKSPEPAPVDYRVTLEGQVIPASAAITGAAVKSDYIVRLQAQKIGPDGREVAALFTGAPGETAPACMTPAPLDALEDYSCADPTGVAGKMLSRLRMSVFPPDPQLRQRLRVRLVDRTLSAEARLRALVSLSAFGVSAFGRVSGTKTGDSVDSVLRDPDVVRGAIQLATTALDPAIRAQVWYTLRGSGDAELVNPLVAALRADLDDDTRLQALGTLAADFAADPRTQAALQTAASWDRDPLVRAVARRALGGTSEWTEYVLASLKDEARSPVKRVEALFYAYGIPSARLYGVIDGDSRVLRTLDDAAMRALAEVLPKAAADSERYAQASITLVSALANMNHPAITEMLLEGLDGEGSWLIRSVAVEALARRIGDSRVRAAFEKVAARDADLQVRLLASNALRGVPDATPSPPRLGVRTEYLQPGPDVPADLAGKLSVVQMALGSVAERAGMMEEDVLLEVGGKQITSGPQLIEVLDALPRDVDIDVLVSRSGQPVRLTARF